MDFEKYAAAFREAAITTNHNEKYVDGCLAYARGLAERGLPIIYDVEHLSYLLGYELRYVIGAAYSRTGFYRAFQVPKKSGGSREIHEPLPSLKEIQRWILDEILSKVSVSSYAKGFVRERSIKENARFHRKQSNVLTLDLKDFFPSIRRPRVYGIFRSFGYAHDVSEVLARLCTRDNTLPQGAPTSPNLSNIAALSLDKRLAAFAKKNGIRYTRYADDITFSGALSPGRVISLLQLVAREEGFAINEKKTRLMGRHQRQEVTGIVVNQKLSAPRNVIRRLRQEVHFIRRFGLAEHMARQTRQPANYVRHLMGIANFVLFLDPNNRDAKRAMAILRPYLPPDAT